MLGKGPLRTLLNMIRLSTMIILLIVAITQLTLTSQQSKYTNEWVHDIKNINNYVEDFDIPSHFLGPLWSLFSHLSIFIQAFVIIFSETNLFDGFYNKYLPLLGSNYGLFWSGLYQLYLTTLGLSHHK